MTVQRLATDRIDRLFLDVANRRKLGTDIADAVEDGRFQNAIDGSPVLTLDVHDPDRRLVASDVLIRNAVRPLGDPDAKTLRPIDLRDDRGLWWRLVAAPHGGERTTLTFIARPQSDLQQHEGPRSWSRGQATRAQAARGLVETVGRRGVKGSSPGRAIPFWAAEIRLRQPLAPLEATDRKSLAPDAEPGRRTDDGTSATAKAVKGVTVKGDDASSSQRRTLVAVVDEGLDMGATELLLLAAIMTVTQESVAGEDPVSVSGQHLGPFHQDSSYGSPADRKDARRAARGFYLRAEKIAKANPGISAADLAEKVQISGNVAGYAQWRAEAEKTLKKIAGGDVDDLENGAGAYVKQYLFSVAKDEDYWQALLRWGPEEVRWRCFIAEWLGDWTVIFAPDRALFQLPARARIDADHAGLLEDPSFDLDTGKTVRELRCTVVADQWRIPVGQSVVWNGTGAADGKWLLASVDGRLRGRGTELIFIQPQEELPEPRSEVAQRADRTDTDLQLQNGKMPTDGGAKGIVDRAAKIAAAEGDDTYVGSSLRPGSTTTSGNKSDHGSDDADQAARDIGVRGIDLLVGPPAPALDRAVVEIGKAFGRDYGDGKRAIVDTFEYRGYRVQIIWRTPAYGGHMGHIHIGVRRA